MEERQEAAINGRRSQNSERVRAHLYERGFRQEPDRRVLVGEVDRGLTSDTGGALRRVMHEAWFCRTNATRIWGVSDPLFSAGNLDRRVAEGVAHAPNASVTVADSRAHCYTGGTERRRCGTAKLFNAKHIDGS